MCCRIERSISGGRVEAAGGIAKERLKTVGRVCPAGGIAKERLKTGRRVGVAGSETEERIVTLGGVSAGIASVRWWKNCSSHRHERKINERQRHEQKNAPQARAANEI